MRKILVTVALLIILFVFLSGVFWKEKQNSVETFSVDAVTEDDIKDELIIAVLEKANGLISIRFGVTPQIGAHNPLGYDELLYAIDSSGKAQLTEYEHIKDYTIPERFEKWLK